MRETRRPGNGNVRARGVRAVATQVLCQVTMVSWDTIDVSIYQSTDLVGHID